MHLKPWRGKERGTAWSRPEGRGRDHRWATKAFKPRVAMSLGPGGFERKNNCAVDLDASTRASENRRAKPINAAAVEAAAPNAHYYGRDDPIVGMPCGQPMRGQQCVVHSLVSVQYWVTRIPRGGGWARNGSSRDAYRIDPQMPMNAYARFGDRRNG